ncbi:hypothetical protein NDU88_011983 [Pleurodeles waltl]|uniref:Uncharacterized protein n=1 Tax=Pleurodeles waltl TaxID=8319 RepID=A0AAV7R4N8_PLEWA|nr:hypothetical protein NDU88_011983 [Pleurodeles waltl]
MDDKTLDEETGPLHDILQQIDLPEELSGGPPVTPMTADGQSNAYRLAIFKPRDLCQFLLALTLLERRKMADEKPSEPEPSTPFRRAVALTDQETCLRKIREVANEIVDGNNSITELLLIDADYHHAIVHIIGGCIGSGSNDATSKEDEDDSVATKAFFLVYRTVDRLVDSYE